MKHRPIFLLIVLILATSATLVDVRSPGAAQSSGGARCRGAPAPRLRIGEQAAVAPNVGPLNLRALPAVSTGIVLQLYSGNVVTVLSGPSCNGHYHWWRVENVNGRRGWVAEGSWSQYYLLPVRDSGRRSPTPTEWSCRPRFDSRLCYTL